MNNTEFFEVNQQAVEAAGIKTYGYSLQQVMAALSEPMAERVRKALLNLQDANKRAMVAACFDVYMQMRSVSSSGDLQLTDRTIIDTHTLLLAEAAKGAK